MSHKVYFETPPPKRGGFLVELDFFVKNDKKSIDNLLRRCKK